MFGIRLYKLIPFALLLLLAVMTWWIENLVTTSAPAVKRPERHDPDYVMENLLSTSLDKSGEIEFSVTARRLTHYPDDDSTEVEAPFVKIFEDRTERWNVEAEKGIATDGGKEVFLQGAVRMYRLPGTEEGAATVNTSNVLIKTEEKIASTQDKITLEDANGFTSATGMHLDMGAEKLKLLSEVRGRYELK